MEKALALIPARSGSKGIPGKNIKNLCGKPLIQYSIEAAAASKVFSDIVVSTDSAEIGDLSKRLGASVPFLRPARIAGDETPMVEVIEHTLQELNRAGNEPALIALLQPTAPLRSVDTIIRAIEALRTSPELDSVVSVTEVPAHFSPFYVMKMDKQGFLVNFLEEGKRLARRQDAPRAYSRTGGIYAFRVSSFRSSGNIYGERCLPIIVAAREAVNIDTMDDWEEAERLLRS